MPNMHDNDWTKRKSTLVLDISKIKRIKGKKNMYSYKKSELYSKSCSFGIFEYVVSDSEWISHPFNVDFGKIK